MTAPVPMTAALALTAAAVMPPETWEANVTAPQPTNLPRVWTAKEIADRLEKSDVMVERSLLQLYHRQTADEANSNATIEDNGVGFNAFDAAFLTDVARWVEQSTYPEGQRLTPRQLPHVRRGLRKYVGQLTRIANREA